MPDTIALVEPSFAPDDLQVVEAALRCGAPSARQEVAAHVAALTEQTCGVTVRGYEDAALLLLRAAGVGPGDDVIITALADPRIAAAVARSGAATVTVDVDPTHLGPARASLDDAATARTRAMFAGPLDGDWGMLEPVAAACVGHEVAFFECVGPWLGMQAGSHALGARGRAALVDLGATVPHGVEHLGVITTSDDTLAGTCRALRSGVDGVSPADASDVQCALAAARIDRLDAIHDACRTVAEAYVRDLAGLARLSLPAIVGSPHARWTRLVVRLDDDLSDTERSEILTGMHRHDIDAAQQFVDGTDAECPVAAAMARRLVSLPLHANLRPSDAALVSQTLDLMIERATFHRT